MFFFIMIFTMNGCRHEILFSSFFLKTPDFPLCLCFNIMEPANPVFRQQMPKKILDLKNICGKILVLLHLFKGNQVFKFETEHKINVYFLIFIALPIVHCTRQKSLLGRHRPSKWLQMAKIPFCGHEPVLWIQTGGTRLEQVKAHPGNVMEPFLWSRMLIGGPNYPKNVPKRAQRGHN